MLDPILSPHVQPDDSDVFHRVTKSSSKVADKAGEDSHKNEQDFDFADLLDIVNPLQHIPIVSQIYQDKAGDEISDQAKAVGDVFYGILTGGVLGVLSAVSNSVLKQQTDKDAGEHLMAFFNDEIIPGVSQSGDTASEKSEGLNNAPANQLGESDKSIVPGLKQASINPPNQPLESFQSNLKSNKVETKNEPEGQQDDYWSLRMKQIFGDDDYG